MRTFGSHELDELAATLERGHVAAIPTDTVYGLAARPDRPLAVEMIYSLKGRPPGLALPLLAADLDDVLSLLGQLPPPAVLLARRFWPGALTLVVPAPASLARSVGSADDTVGVRVPALGLTRRLLARSGPLAVTSANRHGEPPCTNPQSVRAVFGDAAEPSGVLDGGESEAAPSTVARIDDGELRILRHGAVAEDRLRSCLAEG